MATGFNNVQALSDGTIGTVTVNGQIFRLRNVKNYAVARQGSLTAVNGPAGTIGLIKSAGPREITFTVSRLANVSGSVDWHALEVQNTSFTMDLQLLQGVGGSGRFGPRHTFRRVSVSTISDTMAEGGENTFDVTLMALEEEIINPTPSA